MLTGTYDQLRRLILEPSTSGTYTDSVLAQYLLACDNDAYAVAAEIWQEKAAEMQATTYDISADNSSYKYSQKIDNALRLARKYASKRLPKSNLWTKDPAETDDLEDEDFQ